MTEKQIFEGIKQEDRVAEQHLYFLNKQQCIGYAIKQFFWKNQQGVSLKCSQEDAEELYNDACATLIHNASIGRLQELNSKLSTYLITTMRYQWMNKARSYKKQPKEKTLALEPEEEREVLETLRKDVRKAIQQLGEKCREMMTYRYILGWEDYEDIARATGKNNGSVVRNLISRCRKQFRATYLQKITFDNH